MRIFTALVVVGILISIAKAKETAKEEAPLKTSKNATTTAKSSKAAKKPGDNRGKRTLTNFGYPGFSYSVDIADRRQGFADQRSFYTQDGVFNGQNAVGQYQFPDASNNLQDFSPYSQYAQYLEAPEPIIEIIIKDSNETHPTQPPQPIVQKKKKEKVHVYYVKYKKDENNKLHLEEPIASLNNNDATEEEEEEIVHYPTIVTPIPPLKTTTLRTIIHPDSEKFHSISGIHVTFGSEDKSQRGHELQEDNAESVQRSVVALPQGSSFPLKPVPTANVRADFDDTHRRFADRYQTSQNNFYQNQNQNVQREYKPAIQQQQLPVPQALTAFRPQLPLQPQHPQTQPQPQPQQQQAQPQPKPIQQQQHQHQQQQQQYQSFQQQQPQQRPFFNQASQNQAPKQYQRPTVQAPPSSSQYQNYQQQNPYQQQPQQPYRFQHQQQYQQQQYKRPVAQPQKHNHFLPTPAPNGQDIGTRQGPNAYQPVKFRPTPVPNQETFNFPPLAQIQPYNRPPSFAQKPNFPSSIPTQASPTFQTINHSHKTQIQKTPNTRPEQIFGSQQLPFNHKPQIDNSFGSNAGQLHNVLDIRPSKETELLKAIPRYEQHITETVSGNRYNNYSPFTGGNQVIHDIPAPNLGPTTPGPSQSPSSIQYTNNQQYNGFVTSPNPLQYQSSTAAPQFVKTNDGQQLQIVTPMPSTNFFNHKSQQESQYLNGAQPQIIHNSQPKQQQFFQQQQPRQSDQSQFSVSTLHSDVFRELESRKNAKENANIQNRNNFNNFQSGSDGRSTTPPTTPAAPATTSKNAAKASLQLPDEVPDELRQQLLTSGILDNADISVLDYDKVGDVALENLPAEHLQHFYGAGGGAQISESNRVLTVVRPNGDSVDLSEKAIDKVKQSTSLPQKQSVDLKVVRFNADNEKHVSDKFIKADSTVVPPIDLADRQYSRYLPLKINGAQFPIPDVDELRGKKVTSVVVLAPVDNLQQLDSSNLNEGRSERDTPDSKDVKFAIGDIIKQLIKKPTKDNFRKWLEKESRTDVDSQSVVLLVAKSSEDEQEIFMYDIATGAVNKLNGELSSAFVSVAEENASAENLDHASTLDPSILETMMEKRKPV